MADWNPQSYDRFARVRLQPAMDLLARLPELPDGDIIDLGCGSGGVAGALHQNWSERRLIGIDSSPAMLETARQTGIYADLVEADIQEWTPQTLPALIFSNAALQWVGKHETLMPVLARQLPTGGVLAVQMPYQHTAPSHTEWAAASERVLGTSPPSKPLNVLSPEAYFEVLSPLGQFDIWQVEYTQHLEASADGHPVRLFTESTFGKPYLDHAETGKKAQLIDAYEAGIAETYPLRADGSVLFPFRRLFFTLRVA
ncbi:methyltransferase domain-containing protein [Shimia thalassica]|uniref:methyltransferase domain-containing protein n=1 Tax=Shimia thalassica TaxID=1715693 RepID=UPI0026E3BF6F|nr:methyltransferase domain-containing protein [Shimia thalassica]MDO6796931.1 methyltransferase domain-containing protein [Shimia thalassica]